MTEDPYIISLIKSGLKVTQIRLISATALLTLIHQHAWRTNKNPTALLNSTALKPVLYMR